MEPALGVVLYWLLFGGTHVLLATVPVRAALVRALGETGFRVLYSLVSVLTLTLLVRFFAVHRADGAPGPALGGDPAVRAVLIAVVVLGVVFMTGAGAAYPGSPMAVVGGRRVRVPYGLERITRHTFFVGGALVALAHVALATRLVGAVFSAGFAILALAGSWHQDRKLLVLRGPAYADYLARTSLLPFAAIVTGRNRLVWRELPLGTLAAGVVVAVVIRAVHDGMFAHGGLWFVGAIVAGALLLTLQAALAARSQRTRRPETAGLPRTT